MSLVQRWIGGISRLGSVLPLAWFLGVFALYLRARGHLGRWPQPSLDDPKLMPFEFHHGIFSIAIYVLVATLPAVPIALLIQKFAFRAKVRGQAAAFVGGWLLIGSTFLIPGVKFVEWFLD